MPFRKKKAKRSKTKATYHISQPLETMTPVNEAALLNRRRATGFEVTRPVIPQVSTFKKTGTSLLGPPQITEPVDDRRAMLHAAGSGSSVVQGDRPVSFVESVDWPSSINPKASTSHYGMRSSRGTSITQFGSLPLAIDEAVTPAQWLGLTAGPPDPVGRSLRRHPTYLSSDTRGDEKGKQPAASPQPISLMTRKGSRRLNMDQRTSACGTLARAAILRDWFDSHDFHGQSSLEAMELVDWTQVRPHEKVLLLHHAERRAGIALSEIRILLDQLPRKRKDDETLAELRMFTDVENGDADERNVLERLTLYKAPNLGSDPRVPRTIVVLAKIYHGILKEKEQLSLEIGHVSTLLFSR